MGTASVTIRVEESTKRAVRAIAEDFGFDISSIARAFYKQIEREGKIPPSLAETGKSPEGAASVANELADRTSKAAIDAMKLDAVNIIDRASVPDKPSGPNRVMYTAVALLAGLFVAIAIIVLQDMLDTTVKSGDDAEELLGIPVLGRMPKPKKAR